jgi:hypothetical protein
MALQIIIIAVEAKASIMPSLHHAAGALNQGRSQWISVSNFLRSGI